MEVAISGKISGQFSPT